MQYRAFGKTDPGKVRANNEDTFICLETEGVFLVADGMGGHKGGEKAAAIAKEVFLQRIPQLGSPDQGNVEGALRDAFIEANTKVREQAATNPEFSGMGCTCAVVTLHAGNFHLAHVGDSRIYLFRQDTIRQVTRDHSYVEELFTRGLISENEKADHPYRHQITRYIGIAQKLDVDITSEPVRDGDSFLLCSDGLSEEVSPDQMQQILAKNLTAKETVDMLIDAALTNGGRDNVTAVVVKTTAKKSGFFRKFFGW